MEQLLVILSAAIAFVMGSYFTWYLEVRRIRIRERKKLELDLLNEVYDVSNPYMTHALVTVLISEKLGNKSFSTDRQREVYVMMLHNELKRTHHGSVFHN